MTQPATEPAFLTVRELAELLRIKERKVYDLAASGDVPCARATGKLLFPREGIEAWLRAATDTGRAPRPDVFLGSHDPLLQWALRQSRSGLATRFDSSGDGALAFAARAGVATGMHLRDKAGDWNLSLARRAAPDGCSVLVHWATRTRGLAIRPSDAGRIAGPADLVGLRLARRQKEAGAEALWAEVLARDGIDPATIDGGTRYLSEEDAATAVSDGDADATFALAAVARAAGLHFLPLLDERFDILVCRRHWFEPPMQTLLDFTKSAEFSEKAQRLGGYDISRLGRVVWNG